MRWRHAIGAARPLHGRDRDEGHRQRDTVTSSRASTSTPACAPSRPFLAAPALPGRHAPSPHAAAPLDPQA